jgi:hypothetical protein
VVLDRCSTKFTAKQTFKDRAHFRKLYYAGKQKDHFMKKVLLCFGNEFLENDRLAKDIGKEIRNVEVKLLDSPEQIMDYLGNKIYILDVVKGIKKITVIRDTDSLKERNISTLHDLDLGFFLKVIGALEKKMDLTIIGLPMKYDLLKACEEIQKIMSN